MGVRSSTWGALWFAQEPNAILDTTAVALGAVRREGIKSKRKRTKRGACEELAIAGEWGRAWRWRAEEKWWEERWGYSNSQGDSSFLLEVDPADETCVVVKGAGGTRRRKHRALIMFPLSLHFFSLPGPL